jgi:hypothetical protein
MAADIQKAFGSVLEQKRIDGVESELCIDEVVITNETSRTFFWRKNRFLANHGAPGINAFSGDNSYP